MWIDPQGVQFEEKPIRIRLPDFTTRTSEAVTDELLYELGWAKIADTIPVAVEQPVEQPVELPLDAGQIDIGQFDSIGGA